MIRYDCFEWLAPQMTDEIVVTSLSGQRVEWGHLSQREADLNLGSMGNALAVGIGLALALNVVGLLGSAGARAQWSTGAPGIGFALGAALSFGLVLALTQHEVAELDGRVRSAFTMGIVGLLAVPFVAGNFWLRVATTALMYAGLGHAMQLMVGLAGWPALGNVVFFGVGAYTAGLLNLNAEVPVPIAVTLGGVVAAAVSVAASRAMRWPLNSPRRARPPIPGGRMFRRTTTSTSSKGRARSRPSCCASCPRRAWPASTPCSSRSEAEG